MTDEPPFAYAAVFAYLNWRESCCNRTLDLAPVSVFTVIPARLGATRLARKPLRLLGGVPLVVRVFERVRALDLAARIVVATDDDEVIASCAQHNVPCVLTARAHPSGTDRVAEAARVLGFAPDDIVLNVQGDEPFVALDALRGAVEVVRSGLAPIGTAAVRADAAVLARPDVVKVVCDDRARAMYFSRAPIPFLRDGADAAVQAPLVRQHVGVYAYTPDALATWVGLAPHPLELCERLEQLRPLAHGLAIGVADAPPAVSGGIDTEDDLQAANAWWAEHRSAASPHHTSH